MSQSGVERRSVISKVLNNLTPFLSQMNALEEVQFPCHRPTQIYSDFCFSPEPLQGFLDNCGAADVLKVMGGGWQCPPQRCLGSPRRGEGKPVPMGSPCPWGSKQKMRGPEARALPPGGGRGTGLRATASSFHRRSEKQEL